MKGYRLGSWGLILGRGTENILVTTNIGTLFPAVKGLEHEADHFFGLSNMNMLLILWNQHCNM
jgi:hypothetical protein